MRFSTISSAAIIVGTGLAQTPGASPVGLNVIIADLGRIAQHIVNPATIQNVPNDIGTLVADIPLMVLGLSTPVGLGNPVTNVATIVTTVCPALQTVKTTLAASPFGFILGLFINPIISQLRTALLAYLTELPTLIGLPIDTTVATACLNVVTTRDIEVDITKRSGGATIPVY